MPSALVYLGVMLLVICVWFLWLKRPVYEAVLLSFLILLTLTGNWPNVGTYIEHAMSTSLLYSMTAFVAMSITLGRFQLGGIAPAPRGVPQIEVTFDIDANGIVKVSAKDLGTGKEANISITASTNLSQEDIDKAVREAEQYAAEDKARKEEVDTHNMADQTVYQTEKTLNELGDKISAEEKATIQSACDELKEINKGNDVAAIKAATEKVQQAFYAVSEKLYKNAAPQDGAQGGYTQSDDGVVDADYETVD